MPFMKFKQGKGSAERAIYVNLDQVCYISTDGVNEAPDEIALSLPPHSRNSEAS